MNYSIYCGRHEFKFTFNFINTVGDLQTVILQALNIQKNKLLFIIHKDQILGKDYLFTDNLAEKELFDINLFVVLDPYEAEARTKEDYNAWLNLQIADNDLTTANRQLMYFNTNNQLNSPNLDFFTRQLNTHESQAAVRTRANLNNNPNSLRQELNNINLDRPRRRRRPENTTAFSNVFPTTTNNHRRNQIRPTGPSEVAPPTDQNGDLQQMLQSFMGEDGFGAGGGLSSIFSEMINQNIYDLGVTMTQGPNGNSIGLVASGTVGGGVIRNSDFFRRLMSDLEPVPVTLSRESINQLPVFKFSELPEQIKDSNSCSICLEDFGDDDKIRVLLCKHYFHSDCIDRWLTEENVRCPLCRHDSREDRADEEEEQQIIENEEVEATVEEDEIKTSRRKKTSRERKKKKLREDRNK